MKVRVVKDHFCGTGWRAEPETLYLGGVGAVYVEKLEFVLPETWAGMAVTLHIEQEGGTVPQPMLLDGNNNAPVDGRFTTARQGLWMLMATDGEGRREMTMPGKYVCYQTLENGEGTGADGPAMPLRYQYLQLVLEQEARAALEAQRAARYRQWVADRCAAKEHALLLEALSGMRYSDASAWDMIAQLKQRWNSPPPEQAEPVAVESIRLDSKELSIKVGESCPLKATVLPGSAPQTVEWMAEPEGIVQLRENTLTAVKGGTALLTAIAGGKLAQRRVRSVAVSLEKLALDKPSVKLKQGESVTLTATLTPTQSTVTAVSWTTNNAALAVMKDQTTAVENGKAVNTLAALKDGSCIITAAAGGKSAVCSVTVEKNGQASSAVSLPRCSVAGTLPCRRWSSLWPSTTSPVWWWRACSTPAPRPRPVRWKARLAGRASSARARRCSSCWWPASLMLSSAAASSATRRSSAFRPTRPSPSSKMPA